MKGQLPAEVVTAVQQIRSDNTSGAVELTNQAARCFHLVITKFQTDSTVELSEYLTLTSRSLIQAQPAMAPIFNLANNILFELDRLGDLDQACIELKKYVDDYIEKIKNYQSKVVNHTINLISTRDKIMTYSYSSTVLKALINARNEGLGFEIICSESRPVCEGVKLAKDLSENGIKVTLVVDSTLFSLMPKVGLILIGADSISTKGMVNKIGTSTLAVAAKEYNLDLFSLCGSDKFLPEEHKVDLNDQRNPEEILPEKIENVNIENIYFDLTPLDYLTGVVTEEGVIKIDELLTQLDELKKHSSLR
jgi:translation initiation factor 2B subunit (eIF-2B alpha/beta/delta family)